MTAAYDERLMARRRSTLLDACAAARGPMNAKRRKQFDRISAVINGEEHQRFLAATPDVVTMLYPDTLAQLWQQECKAAGIGTGVLSWFFWNFFLPVLIKIAKEWLEANRIITISSVAGGASEGRNG